MSFTEAAVRLAGMAGALLGWSPDQFWSATPVELGAVFAALAGEAVPPPSRNELARLMEAFPDG